MNARGNKATERTPLPEKSEQAAAAPGASDLQKWQCGGLDFRRERTTLSVRQATPAAAVCILIGLAPLVVIVFFTILGWIQLNSKDSLFACLRWMPLFLAPAAIAFFARAVQGRTIPFCIDVARGEVWRGSRHLCALKQIKGVRATWAQTGRCPTYRVELVLDSKWETIELPEVLSVREVRQAAGELARCLNVPCLPERGGGLF